MSDYSEKELNQIKEIQHQIHYAPEKKKEYLRQIQQQEYLQFNLKDDTNNHSL